MTQLEAALNIQRGTPSQLQLGAEKILRFGLYLTIYADSLDEFNFVRSKSKQCGQQMLFSKVASSQQE